MYIHSTGFPAISMPTHTPPDGGGGGGSDTFVDGHAAPAPQGGGGGNGGTVSTTGGVPTTKSTPYDVSDDTEIRIKGSDKPVKFGEHVKGLQGQFTKASQEAANLRKQVEQYKQQLAQSQQQRQAPPQQGQAGGDVFEALSQLPYLTGKDAVEVVKSIAGQIQQRDMVLLSALKQMQAMKGVLDGLNQNHTAQSFEGKISKWLKEGGYPDEAADYMKETYLAYEGDDLDAEFPQIFKNRWEQLEKLHEARRVQKIQSAKRPAFVPGKGGVASPSKPLQIKANASSKDLANELFGLYNDSDLT